LQNRDGVRQVVEVDKNRVEALFGEFPDSLEVSTGAQAEAETGQDRFKNGRYFVVGGN
jgi:hypothetical protein